MIKNSSILVCLLFLLSGCSSMNNKTYTSLTDHQIEKFITEEGIQALDIKQINQSTLIFYSKNSSVGLSILNADKNGKISNINNWTDESINPAPVEFMTQNGLDSYLSIIIHDKDILNKAKKIQAIYNNQICEQITNGKRGYIILCSKHDNSSKFEKVIIFDNDNNVLFSHY